MSQSKNFNLDPKYDWYRVHVLGIDLKNTVPLHFRSLTYKELVKYNTLLQIDEVKAVDYVINVAVKEELSPKFPYGSINLVVDLILKKSDFEEAFKDANQFLNSEDGIMQMKTVAVIPSVTFELLENCSPQHYARYIIMGNAIFDQMMSGGEEQAPQNGSYFVPSGQNGAGYEVESFSYRRE